ncbi:bactofilin family protein [Ramlibacter sp. PS4R-6]|uniref:bactofilin family protein n=1 Tax=Ramlibacter sp. PS4R-6 TaxID=3133438 RepID=UPI0030AF78A4
MTDISRAIRRAFLAAALVLPAIHAVAAGDDSAAIIIDNDSNMVVIGGRVVPPHPIPQNFAAAGGRIVVDKPIGHNAGLAGGSVEIRAPIGGKLGAAGGSITIDAAVGSSVGAAGGEVRIAKNGSIGGTARITGSRLDVDGVVRGSLHAVGEILTINGEVQGDVDAEVEQLVLGPGAKVGGNIKYIAGSEIVKGEGATIGGQVVRRDSASLAHEASRSEGARTAITVIGFIATAMVFLVVLACGAIFLAVAPIFSVEAPDRLRASPGKSFGMGLLTVVGAPILAVLLMITIVGIPVGILIFALYPLALLLGFVVGILWLASWITQLARKPPPPTVARAIGYFAIALLAATIVSKIPVLGGFLVGLLLLMGVGALEVELFRRMRAGSGAMRGRVEVVRP